MALDSWIAGLMAENYESVSFIPITTLRKRYLAKNRYVLQLDERGNRVGYLLHGPIHYGQPVIVSQHCIQYEKRLKGYGEKAFMELLDRSNRGGASSIRLRCADDLPAVKFWQSVGFRIARIEPGGSKRARMIFVMYFPLNLPLFVQTRK